MNYLLDTHTLLWLTNNPAKLSKRALYYLEEAKNLGGAISAQTIWEIGFKMKLATDETQIFTVG